MSSLSVSSYGSYSSTSNASAWATARSAHQAKMFAKADSDSSGELSSDELAKGMDALRSDPPSTLAFAQSRQGQGSGQGQVSQVPGVGTGSMSGVQGGQGGKGGKGDDLFSKLDSNGDGSLDSTEVKAFADKVKSDTGNDISDQLSKLDTDQSGQISQSEFDAGRPSRPGSGAGGMGGVGGVGGPGGAGGPPPMGGMPPGGGMGGASSGSSGSSSNSSSSASSSSSSSSSGSYDPLDTNRDGKVSDAERLAAALKKLYAQSGAASQSSSSNNTSNSSSTASSSTSVSITV